MPPRFLQIGDMHDQGIEQGASLGGEDGGNSLAIGGIGAKAVNGLGWKGDKAAFFQDTGGFGDAFAVGGRGFGGNINHGAGNLAS